MQYVKAPTCLYLVVKTPNRERCNIADAKYTMSFFKHDGTQSTNRYVITPQQVLLSRYLFKVTAFTDKVEYNWRKELSNPTFPYEN